MDGAGREWDGVCGWGGVLEYGEGSRGALGVCTYVDCCGEFVIGGGGQEVNGSGNFGGKDGMERRKCDNL